MAKENSNDTNFDQVSEDKHNHKSNSFYMTQLNILTKNNLNCYFSFYRPCALTYLTEYPELTDSKK